jgi:hypothetical protein
MYCALCLKYHNNNSVNYLISPPTAQEAAAQKSCRRGKLLKTIGLSRLFLYQCITADSVSKISKDFKTSFVAS